MGKAIRRFFISSGCLSGRLIRKNMLAEKRRAREKISDYF
ncbi:hypothetical protein A8H35_27155 [Burkholderia thailandensis]|nr:hypothetical protein A8H35_27155 [Burkholderia thailandensis]AWY66228.1 hypothetical protein A8H36_12320 [Burkholderia thailandensis]PHH35263.1 hypothetical protein CRX59_29275 [Burkholderia thailandensis]